MSPTNNFPSVTLTFFNTATRSKEPFKPYQQDRVTLYTCGPTVYDFAHIGNFRTYVFEDLLRRTLQFFGFSVTQVMNLTDVDDKTIKGAIRQNVDLNTYTKPFIDAFFEDLKTLHIEPVEYYPAATDYIPQMLGIIEKLLEKGYAYKGSDGSIYYAIRHFSRYGCLSHLKLDELKAGASDRVASDEYDKEHVADFVLWKSYDPERDGKIFWESPYGRGRPGWHLECSAMAIHLLGETIDIHCGGVDNMFPHHENEIAQSEAYTGKPFVGTWLHAEHLVVENKKMSKSLGNFYTLRDLLKKGYSGQEVRYMLLQTHYKTQLNFTLEGLEGARHALQRLNDFIWRLQEIQEDRSECAAPIFEQAERAFAQALADDLNISPALAAVFEMVREMNGLIDQERIGQKEANIALNWMRRVNRVLGVLSFEKEAIPLELQEALAKRIEARQAKNWAEADRLRDWIHAQGYAIEDSPKGARLKKAASLPNEPGRVL